MHSTFQKLQRVISQNGGATTYLLLQYNDKESIREQIYTYKTESKEDKAYMKCKGLCKDELSELSLVLDEVIKYAKKKIKQFEMEFWKIVINKSYYSSDIVLIVKNKQPNENLEDYQKDFGENKYENQLKQVQNN